jgi:hypothetical protein
VYAPPPKMGAPIDKKYDKLIHDYTVKKKMKEEIGKMMIDKGTNHYLEEIRKNR